MMRTAFAAGFLGSAVFAATPLYSQDTPTTPTVETQTPDPRLDPQRIEFAGEVLPMSLPEVVVTAFDQNLDIEISVVDVQISREERIAEEGIYDPTFEGSVGYRSLEGENNSFTFNTTGTGGTGSTNEDGTFVIDQKSEEASASLSQLIPTGATISLGYDRTRTDFQDIRGDFQPLNPEESHRAFVRLRQPLLKNFGPTVTNLGIRTAKLEEQIQKSLFRQEIENQLAAVMSAYWDLVFSIRNLEVQRTSLEAALELERVNQVRVRTGSAPRSDLFQSQAQAAERRNNVIDAKSAILAQQDRLLQLLNWSSPVEDWSRPILPTDQPDSYDLDLQFEDELLVETALQERGDLDATRLSLEIAETTKDALWWQRFPELNAIAEYGLNGLDDGSRDAFDEVSDAEYEDYFVGLEFRYPLGNRTARANYRRSKRQMERTRLNIDRIELAVITQVRSASRAIRTAQESIEASESQVRAAQETLNSERKRLEVGASTTFNVLDFQEDLARARVNSLQARVNYQKGLVELERSRGTLLDSIAEDLNIMLEVEPRAGRTKN